MPTSPPSLAVAQLTAKHRVFCLSAEVFCEALVGSASPWRGFDTACKEQEKLLKERLAWILEKTQRQTDVVVVSDGRSNACQKLIEVELSKDHGPLNAACPRFKSHRWLLDTASSACLCGLACPAIKSACPVGRTGREQPSTYRTFQILGPEHVLQDKYHEPGRPFMLVGAEALSLSDDEKVTSQQKTEVLVPTNAKPAGWTHSKVPWLWQETMNKNAWKMVNAGSVINLSPSLVLVRCIAWLQTQATRA